MKFLESEFSSLKRPKRAPLRTYKEMAAEFGLTFHQLNGYVRRSAHPFPPVALDCTGGTVSNRWYDPALVRAWWAAYEAKK